MNTSGVDRVRAAVVGHVEWVQFVRAERLPRKGEGIDTNPIMELAAGGGAAAAVQLAGLGAETHLYTALADDELGHRAFEQLTRQGVRIHAAWRKSSTRRVLTVIHDDGERTIIHYGALLEPRSSDELPWQDMEAIDSVYFTAGDQTALAASRRAQVLVASPRALKAFAPEILLDAIIYSTSDTAECSQVSRLPFTPRLVVATDGPRGGTYRAGSRRGSWAAAPLPGLVVDGYGCGDAFAAGLTFGLGNRLDIEHALKIAARCGAACLTRSGPYERVVPRSLPGDHLHDQRSKTRR